MPGLLHLSNETRHEEADFTQPPSASSAMDEEAQNTTLGNLLIDQKDGSYTLISNQRAVQAQVSDSTQPSSPQEIRQIFTDGTAIEPPAAP